ncbi:hypothetical protein LOTGIDRAFT_164106 [Lottia gigantea]|uniref:Integrase-type domain-containing protein n=1 Tax=Lottia gigantea TaxID=225164 RepID=V4A1I4_LOTGI|nr:hypothetical protein LOTGIDRAFT_164106 [Lottia gigantea]ESO90517.1 hypothetical protein LOTGIDRAFT_164106 [Lottia gigantea]
MAHSNSVNYRNPPVLAPDGNYESWKSEIEIWTLVTDLPKKKHALAVSVALKGQAKERALAMDIEQLSDEEHGMRNLISELDKLFKTDAVDLAYSKFDNWKREQDTSMVDFIIDFEQKYAKCVKYNMDLPDTILAFKILDYANLSEQEKQLALTAASDLRYDTMKSALKRIFTKLPETNDKDSSVTLKEENALYTRNKPWRKTYLKNQKQNERDDKTLKGTNPLDKYGRRSKCLVCQSIFHWAKDCPDKESVNCTKLDQNCQFIDNARPDEIMTVECSGCAVLDTACSKTVCGKKWFDDFVSLLTDEERSKIVTKSSSKTFKFGDGARVQSEQNVVIPAKIAEGKTSSRTVYENLSALNSAREAFTKSECSERLRRALRKQTRTYDNVKYKNGDEVYYKRPDSTEWRGPGTVIGQDGAVVFIRHGGLILRVHYYRLRPVIEDPKFEKDPDVNVTPDRNIETVPDEEDNPPIEQNEDHEIIAIDDKAVLMKVKPGQNITFKNDEKDKISAKVINRAGKASGKYCHWYNIENEDGNRQSIDLSQLPILCVTDKNSLVDAVNSTKQVNDKRLRLEISSIKELLQSGQISNIIWSETKAQLADCLTKKGASPYYLLKTLHEVICRHCVFNESGTHKCEQTIRHDVTNEFKKPWEKSFTNGVVIPKDDDKQMKVFRSYLNLVKRKAQDAEGIMFPYGDKDELSLDENYEFDDFDYLTIQEIEECLITQFFCFK